MSEYTILSVPLPQYSWFTDVFTTNSHSSKGYQALGVLMDIFKLRKYMAIG